MRRRLETLADQLEEFVSEDAHDALVVNGDGAVAGLLGAAIDRTQQGGSIDVSFSFFETFEGVDGLAAKLIADIEAFAETAKVALAPPTSAATPMARLVATLCAFASEVRARGDVRVAVWICPSAVADEDAYVASVVALVTAFRSADRLLRVAAREPCPIERPLRAALRDAALPTLEVAVDLSPAAMRDALAEDAMDPSADPSARAAAALSVAMADAATGRTEDALSALGTLAEFHRERGDASSRALCLVLAGSVLAIMGELDNARARVSQGLALAVDAKALPVVLSGAMLAGHLSMRAGDPTDADVRFDVAAQLAARIGGAEMVAEALLQRGHALVQRGSLSAARDAWLCAVAAAQRAESIEHERAALAAIADLYRSARMDDDARRIERRLFALPQREEACSHAHAP